MLSKQFSHRPHGSIRKLKAYGAVGILAFGIALVVSVQNVRADENISDSTKVETIDNANVEVGVLSASISDTDKEIATKEEEVLKTESEVQGLTKREAEEKAKLQVVQDDIQKTNVVVEDKAKELEGVKEAIAKQADDTKTKDLQNVVENATAEATKAQDAVNVADKQLADEKAKSEAANSESKKQAEAELSKAQGDAKTADTAVETLKKQIEEASKAGAFPYSTTFTSTDQWNKAFVEYFNLKNEKNPYEDERAELFTKFNTLTASEYNRRIEEINRNSATWASERDAKLKTLLEAAISVEPIDNKDENIIVGTTDPKSQTVYDVNNLPQDVLVELSQYFAELINNTRKELGLPIETRVHLDDITFAKEVAAQVEKEKYAIPRHFGRAINDAARRRGLETSAAPGVDTTNQYYENLMSVMFPEGYGNFTKVNKDNLYTMVHSYFQGFMHEGKGSGHYGHATSLMSVKNVGLAFSVVGDTLKMHVISVEPTMYEPKDTAKVNFYEKDQTQLLPRKDFTANNVDTAKVNALKAELAQKEKVAEAAKGAVKAKEEALKNLTPNTNSAKIKELETALATAKENLAAKTLVKDTAVKALDDYLKSIPKDDKLTEKQTNLEKEIATLKDEQAKKQESYNKLVEEIKAIGLKKTEASEKVATLKAELENLKKQKAKEEARLEAEKKAKEEANAKAEADRLAKETAEAERKEAERKAEEARLEDEKKAKEEADAKAEADRLAKEKAEADAKAKAEAERKEAERKAEEARLEAEKKAKEEANAKAEADRLAKAKAEAERKEAERKAEEARKAEESRREDEKKAKEEANAKAEAARLAKEKAEAEAKAKAEAERKAEEDRKAEEARREAENKAQEEANAKAEAARLAKEKAEADKKTQAEADRVAKEQVEEESDLEFARRIGLHSFYKSHFTAEDRIRLEAEARARAEKLVETQVAEIYAVEAKESTIPVATTKTASQPDGVVSDTQVSSNHQRTLPNTGDQKGNLYAFLGSLLVASGLAVLKLKKRR